MKRKSIVYLWCIVVVFAVILIPYVQNAGAGPNTSGISFFMGYYVQDFAPVYLYTITLGMIEGALIILFLQSLLKNIQGVEPTKFDLNQ